MSKSTASPPEICDTLSLNVSPEASASVKDVRIRRTEAALREALLVLLKTQPFEQISVRDICAAAGVHYATFFRHYRAKEALLERVAAAQVQHLVALTMEVRSSAGELTAFEALCVHIEDDRVVWGILLNGGAKSALREEWRRQALRVAAATAPHEGWLPAELGAICSVSLIADALCWWLDQPPGAFSAGDVARMLSRLVGGLGNR